MPHYQLIYSAPIGDLLIVSNGEALIRVDHIHSTDQEINDDEICQQAYQQLDQYFKGQRTEFDLPIDLQGTPFQLSTWKALQSIPFGETISYGEQANRMENPKAVRAVGAANGKNPISIIIPCHRVIGKNGKLTGYAGGLDRKEWLLDFEK
ncbi:methylated-DNA--[protein]-cysteine S-methyltransferase [Vibrio sp. SS-MA-C1-2]|uniref:methylated-DNA--[protein]-cysteine S-methyltransferase n=1 Tax=Vibrio sp. SS-MA-C1-2 TaxID=2908646 RepID=UPI001F18F7E8|nr:methylated-DNA--[protein]-cysteine S-methyltransferase [Vibrio sp. SS-MA-C1-2]UJF18984.1 methylated-DNA--[protein]-cysteine S-methyltransferase [Vibrio sp. SS-MA-C1-2]